MMPLLRAATAPFRQTIRVGTRSTEQRAMRSGCSSESTDAKMCIRDRCWGQPIDSYLIHDSGPFRLPKFGYSRGFDKVFFLHGHETDHQYYAQEMCIRDSFTDSGYLEKNFLPGRVQIAETGEQSPRDRNV